MNLSCVYKLRTGEKGFCKDDFFQVPSVKTSKKEKKGKKIEKKEKNREMLFFSSSCVNVNFFFCDIKCNRIFPENLFFFPLRLKHRN